jgi:predicted membrane-bound spermidine synthase
MNQQLGPLIESPGLMAFVAGAMSIAFALVGLFFLRFFLRTRDRLFLAFAGAFGLMALNQALVGLLDIPREEQSPFYLLRLLAFLLIIGAIVSKNLGRG